jgi:cellulose biosynthesis protein BcsQ
MPPPRIALLSSKGGTGKTCAAVTIAAWWATHRGPVTLIDTDPQDTLSAVWWLDRSDDQLANLAWATATLHELMNSIDRLTTTAVIIDTAPRLDDAAVQHIANLVDLVLIPGAVSEFSTMVQTLRTVRAASTTPAAAVITRTLTTTLQTQTTEDVLDILRQAGLPIAGTIRQSQALAEAVTLGRRPDQLTGDARARLDDDVRSLMISVGNLTARTEA